MQRRDEAERGFVKDSGDINHELDYLKKMLENHPLQPGEKLEEGDNKAKKLPLDEVQRIIETGRNEELNWLKKKLRRDNFWGEGMKEGWKGLNEICSAATDNPSNGLTIEFPKTKSTWEPGEYTRTSSAPSIPEGGSTIDSGERPESDDVVTDSAAECTNSVWVTDSKGNDAKISMDALCRDLNDAYAMMHAGRSTKNYRQLEIKRVVKRHLNLPTAFPSAMPTLHNKNNERVVATVHSDGSYNWDGKIWLVRIDLATIRIEKEDKGKGKISETARNCESVMVSGKPGDMKYMANYVIKMTHYHCPCGNPNPKDCSVCEEEYFYESSPAYFERHGVMPAQSVELKKGNLPSLRDGVELKFDAKGDWNDGKFEVCGDGVARRYTLKTDWKTINESHSNQKDPEAVDEGGGAMKVDGTPDDASGHTDGKPTRSGRISVTKKDELYDYSSEKETTREQAIFLT